MSVCAEEGTRYGKPQREVLFVVLTSASFINLDPKANTCLELPGKSGSPEQ